MTDEEKQAQEALSSYRARISAHPVLLSLLYDADMLPEQIVTMRGARSVAAVVVAFEEGMRLGKMGVTNETRCQG